MRSSRAMSMLSLQKILWMCVRAQQMSLANCVAVTPCCRITSLICCPMCMKKRGICSTCRTPGFHAHFHNKLFHAKIHWRFITASCGNVSKETLWKLVFKNSFLKSYSIELCVCVYCAFCCVDWYYIVDLYSFTYSFLLPNTNTHNLDFERTILFLGRLFFGKSLIHSSI